MYCGTTSLDLCLMNLFSLSDSPFSKNPLLLEQLLAPMENVRRNFTRSGRDCPGIPDPDFLRLGFLRTLSQARSGRDFLQQQAEIWNTVIQRSSFFDSLHSERRLHFLNEICWELYARGRQSQPTDLLACFPELLGCRVWAVDGHKIEHACHALRDGKGRQVAPNTLYLLCLHSGLLFNLAAVQGDGHYHHEMPVLRNALPEFLRKEFARGKGRRPPLCILDPAFIDNHFWDQQSQLRQSGALMIIRAKDGISPKHFQKRSFDANDPVNVGIDTDNLITFAGGQQMRLIQYADPETGECYQFLTTDLELRPGVIAWLYLLRWRIEKVFDTSKNKLEETKAWATGEVARKVQGHFLALTHNLLVLFRGFLESDFGIREEKLEDKREKQLEQREKIAQAQGRTLHPLHRKMPPIVQLSLQFIRTLRNQILAKVSFYKALPQIRAMLVAYL
jgi:Transposase DDE domain